MPMTEKDRNNRLKALFESDPFASRLFVEKQ